MFYLVSQQVSHPYIPVSAGLCFWQVTTMTDDRTLNMLCTFPALSCCIFFFMCVLTEQDIDSMKVVERHFRKGAFFGNSPTICSNHFYTTQTDILYGITKCTWSLVL